MKTIILIPPSEGKNIGGTHPPLKSLHPITEKLLGEMKKADPEKLLGVKGKNLKHAIIANSLIKKAKTLPAIERYKGTVYTALNHTTVSDLGRLRIVSGLFGLIKATDLIPEYKLKIEKLNADALWKPVIAEQLKEYFVIDLLPQAHRKAVEYTHGVKVDFVQVKNGKKMPAGHQGKHIKGRFVRWLINNNITSPKNFKKFTEEGYSWTGEYFLKTVQ